MYVTLHAGKKQYKNRLLRTPSAFMPLPFFILKNRAQSVLNVHFMARCVMILQLGTQIIIAVTEGSMYFKT
jgi:hypothetical protein